jgi:hypothetical protein
MSDELEMALPKITKEEALDRFYQCIVEATRKANAQYGFGSVPFRRDEGGVTIMGVRYPDGHEDRYEVGAEYIQ